MIDKKPLTIAITSILIASLSSFSFGQERPSDTKTSVWKLKYEENFTENLNFNDKDWVKDTYGENSPWHVDHLDDDGEFFHIKGGEHFKKVLNSFSLLRKRVEFGQNHWLTAEFAARDSDGDGQPENPPQLLIKDGKATIDVPAWNTGLLITATEPLPEEYRVEVTLYGFDFGGKREGSWEYDNKYNGYTKGDCKTNFPWVRKGDYSQEGAENINPCEEPWKSVTRENGYYFLAIMDYAKPAPHNNLFIHNHRKVGMDSYSVDAPWSTKYRICNPKTGEVMPYNDGSAVGVNQIFFDGSHYRDKSFAYNEFIMPTACGVFYGDKDPNMTIVASAEIRPEVLPNEPYTFAIERTKTGYATELSGNFAHIGQSVIRNSRPFIGEDGRPIWHYNQTAKDYDGQFDESITFEGPFGQYTKQMWPKDSAYPDNFIVGIPHLNYYEGRAVIGAIRLYVPSQTK